MLLTMSSLASVSLVDAPETHSAGQVLAEDLGYRFNDSSLLSGALTHRSWCAEFGGPSNERLEFLGDAVLSMAVTQLIYRAYPELPEGQLAKIRSGVVSANALAKTARQINLGAALYLGKGEQASGGRDKSSILADAFEAVLGAVYLDGGLSSAIDVIENLMGQDIDQTAMSPGFHDFKTRLQELSAQRFRSAPVYEMTAEGPDHDRRFSALVSVDGQIFGPGTGTSKKRAEQDAAHMAWQFLENPLNPQPSPKDPS